MRFTILCISMLIAGSLFAKKADEQLPAWVNKSERKKLFPQEEYYTFYSSVKNVKLRKAAQYKEELQLYLKQQLTSNIASSISSSSQLVINETTNSGYSEEFSLNTQVKTNIDLFDITPDFFYSKSQQTLHGVISIKKSEFARKLDAVILSKLKLISSDLQLYNPDRNTATLSHDISLFEKRLEVIKSQWVILNATGYSNSTLTSMLANAGSQIKNLHAALHSAENELMISNAQKLLAQEKFKQALVEFRRLKLKFPTEERVLEGELQSAEAFEQHSLNKSELLSLEYRFSDAVSCIKDMIILLPDTKEKHEKRVAKIEKEAFAYYANQLDIAIKSEVLSKINSAYNDLKQFRYVDANSFKKYTEKVEDVKANTHYISAKYEYKNGNYKGCTSKINYSLQVCPENNSYKKLREKAIHKLYRKELNNLKLDRPHLWALQLGVAAQTNHNNFNNGINHDQWNFHAIPAVSFGIYRKYGIKKSLTATGKDKSKANLFGFQYIYTFHSQPYPANNEITQSYMPDNHELNMVVGFKRKYQVKAGICYSDSAIMQPYTPEQFCLSINRHFFAAPVAVDFELKTYFDLSGNAYPVVKLAFLMNGNFKRKIRSSDRKELKSRVNQKY